MSDYGEKNHGRWGQHPSWGKAPKGRKMVVAERERGVDLMGDRGGGDSGESSLSH